MAAGCSRRLFFAKNQRSRRNLGSRPDTRRRHGCSRQKIRWILRTRIPQVVGYYWPQSLPWTCSDRPVASDPGAVPLQHRRTSPLEDTGSTIRPGGPIEPHQNNLARLPIALRFFLRRFIATENLHTACPPAVYFSSASRVRRPTRTTWLMSAMFFPVLNVYEEVLQ